LQSATEDDQQKNPLQNLCTEEDIYHVKNCLKKFFIAE